MGSTFRAAGQIPTFAGLISTNWPAGGVSSFLKPALPSPRRATTN
ncbi:hypothetical protein SAMN06269173_10547 [Hymenobacter mucosus]|uniref:Uncharacterized protein n=1 Tax=Hymenobacter mucosus TaxID=1411120 RepID=A0A238YAA4_9BACT|nr:hypothetical protein SAMN06269173_10547 [Hymenobacter mucosus]